MDANKKIIVKRIGKLALALTASIGLSLLAPAKAVAQTDTTAAANTTQAATDIPTISLEPGRPRQVTTKLRIKEANIRDPEIADVVALNANELLVTGKKPGVTPLIVKDENGQAEVMEIEVASNIESLRRQLVKLFPGAGITADDDNGVVTLHGQVRTLEIAHQAEEIATPYSAGGKVHNILEVAGGQQVLLEVKFAEVSKDITKELGVNFGGTDGTSYFANNVGINSFGTPAPNTLINPLGILQSGSPASNVTMFGQGALAKVAFQYFIQALETDNLVRILAEPNLVAISGQKASFLAGGEVPYPVPQSSSGGGTVITIDYKKYGVQLNFTPVVLGDGRIRLEVNPDVSQLDYAHAVNVGAGEPVPGLTERSVNTTVELAEGQTLALAGLLQENINANSSEFPILGDLPVLGALFRSTQYERSETELVVLVTPKLVRGLNPADVTRAPGEKWRNPNDAELYLLKDMGGEEMDKSLVPGPAPKYHGQFGFNPSSQPADGK